MTQFESWSDLPPHIAKRLDAIESFVADVDGKTICTPTDGDTFIDEGTIDASNAVEAVNGLAETCRLYVREILAASAIVKIGDADIVVHPAVKDEIDRLRMLTF